MNLQRISEFAENQEGKGIFMTYADRSWMVCIKLGLTFGSFRLNKPDELHHFE